MEEDKERNAFLRQLFRILKGDFSHQGIAFFLYPALKKTKEYEVYSGKYMKIAYCDWKEISRMFRQIIAQCF